MRRPHILLLSIAAFLCSVTVNAAPVNLGDSNGANNNPHNLSNKSNNTIEATSETQICIFCHIPHAASSDKTQAAGDAYSGLWNRLPPANMGSFPTFDGTHSTDPAKIFGIGDSTIIGTTKYGVNDVDDEYPNGSSKLCLSCHDGVTAIGTLLSGDAIAVGGDASKTMSDLGSTMIFNGTNLDLSASHPISFVYNAAVVTYLNGLGKTNDTTMTLPSTVPLDAAGRMQCTTCHEPHRSTRDSGAGYNLPFWRGSGSNEANEYVAVCNDCHTSNIFTYNGTIPSGQNHSYP